MYDKINASRSCLQISWIFIMVLISENLIKLVPQTGTLPLCWSCSGCWGPVCCSEWPSGRPGSCSSRWDSNLPPAPGRTSSGGCSGSHSRCAGTESPETKRSKWLRIVQYCDLIKVQCASGKRLNSHLNKYVLFLIIGKKMSSLTKKCG